MILNTFFGVFSLFVMVAIKMCVCVYAWKQIVNVSKYSIPNQPRLWKVIMYRYRRQILKIARSQAHDFFFIKKMVLSAIIYTLFFLSLVLHCIVFSIFQFFFVSMARWHLVFDCLCAVFQRVAFTLYLDAYYTPKNWLTINERTITNTTATTI